jgi:RimJ/RimL family protein N-acetyltransferase
VSEGSEPHPSTGQPVGLKVDTTPAQRPGPVTLQGRFGRVERLDPVRHGAALWDAFKGRDDLWTYSSNGPFADEASFQAWLVERATLADPFYFSIVEPGGRALGVATLMEIRPATRVIEVGHIVYGPELQRAPLATEAQYLLARYAIEELHYRRYEWKCHGLNAASRSAALRLGFTFEGSFPAALDREGAHARYGVVFDRRQRVAAVRAAFEAWLAPENFDADGRQVRRLEDIRKSLS